MRYAVQKAPRQAHPLWSLEQMASRIARARWIGDRLAVDAAGKMRSAQIPRGIGPIGRRAW